MTKPYRVELSGGEVVMMLDDEGIKQYPGAVPLDEPKDEAAVSHKARRPAKQATVRKRST